MANRCVKIIEEYITDNILTQEDYEFLHLHTKGVLYNYHLLTPDIDYMGITNQFLIDIKESKYNKDLSEGERKNYINLNLLYSAQKVMAVSWNIIDIPPYMLKEYQRHMNGAKNLTKVKLADIKNAMENVPLEMIGIQGYKDVDSISFEKQKEILNNKIVLEAIGKSLSHKEKVVLVNYFKYGLSKKEIGEQLGVTGERARQIINSSIKKCKRNVERYKDVIV